MYKIEINVSSQRLSLAKNGQNMTEYTIATAKNGVGQQYGSQQTPLGKHIVRAKIGADQKVNTIFVRRRPTGEIYSEEMGVESAGKRDFILTRILWLSGCEVGKNRLGNVDTMRRKIYIHGCPDSCVLGVPSSHGCIKMHNQDIIELFNIIPVYTPVEIMEGNNNGRS